MGDVRISPVRTDADVRAVRDLFACYAASLPIDLAYQDVAREMAALPGRSAPPRSALFLATAPCYAPTPAGTVFMRLRL